MASNVRTFNLNLQKYARDTVPELIAQRHRAAALEMLRRLIEQSPRDTGRFVGNWQVSVETPATGETGREDKGGTLTLAAGAAAIQQIDKPTISWITNNVPYAVKLSQGHSPQAPPGWVDAVVEGLKVWLESQ
jgi:hypothetical protein